MPWVCMCYEREREEHINTLTPCKNHKVCKHNKKARLALLLSQELKEGNSIVK